MSVSVRKIEVVEIMIRLDNSEWASVRLQESTGSVVIQSDFGNWSYFWPPQNRSGPIEEFLRRLDYDYAGGKFLGGFLWVYDEDETKKAIRRWILEYRRDFSLDKDEARREWDLLESFEGFDQWCNDTEIDDCWEFHGTAIDHQWMAFWERIWVPFVKPALAELGQMGAPRTAPRSYEPHTAPRTYGGSAS